MTRRPGGNVGYSPLCGCAGDRVQVHCGTGLGTHFQQGSKFVPRTVLQYTWQPSRLGLSCNLKVANSHPTRLAAAEADALGTEWSLHWNLSIPVACSKSLTLLPTVQVETGLWGWTINKDSFYFSFHCKRGCQQFQAVYVKKMFGMTPQADCANPIAKSTPGFPWGIAFYYVQTGSGLPVTLEDSPSPLVPWPSTC